ncbi:MAG: sigma-70 family RNA polymerase sigma factor [Ferruginibacter sp.]
MQEIPKYSEEELIAALQMRSEAAFSLLYDNYSGALNGVIMRMVNDMQLAEDILQEAFIKIWNNFKQYDAGKGRLFTWMVNIARNLTIDTLRSKGYRKQQKVSGDEYAVTNYGEQDNTGKIDGIGMDKRLSALKPEYKKLVDLAYYSGFTQEEISKQLDIPLGTVKTRLRSAIMELRKMMTEP